MVGSALALSLIGLGAVRALPAGKTVEERQVWLGPGTGTFHPGDGDLHPCLTNIPLQQQPPCLLPPIVGGINPSTKKKRQVIIGDPSGGFTPGQGDLPPCLTDTPLDEQPPCLLAPIIGGLNPSTKHKRQFGLGDGTGTWFPGQGEVPVCLTDVPLNEQPPCILPPIVGGINPSNKKRGFVLPPDYATNTKAAIEELELDLERLQNKGNKSKQDLDDIEAIKAALRYLAGITSISAPPGTGSTFIPGKRSFILPPDYATNTKKVIETLEKELIQLQNKKNKTAEDRDDIKAIKAALVYLAGITNISAPPGTGSTFTPGKRAAEVNLDAVGTYASVCPNLEGAELALENLLHKDKPTAEERIVIQRLTAFLKGCGITIVKSPDGTTTIIKPSDKRDAQFDVTGLQTAYFILLDAATKLYPSQPSFNNWLAIQQISGILELHGVTTTFTVDSSTGHTKRETDTITIGVRTCQLTDVNGLRAALAALLAAYGDPAKSPVHIFLVEQVLVTALQLCGQGVPGWTTITPGSPIPGGPIIPDPTVPGGAIIPDPTVPGGDVHPSTKKARQAPVGDPSAMLAALTTLEEAYGTYGSGKIPAPVFLIMVNIVTILQSIPGVVVPGWPVLGQGSVVLTPST